jgi:Cof subfamily protein (haloacid dehalogenase superfamily)
MKKNVLAVALALMASIGAYAEKNTISSPDGKLNVVVEDHDGKLYYSIDYAGKRMMEESQLGLLANVGDFSQGLTYQGKNEIKVEKSYDLRTAKVSHVDYHANQLNVTYLNGKKQPMTVTFNVSNKMNIRKVENLFEALEPHPTKLLMTGDPADMLKAENELSEILGDRMDIFRSAPFFLELVPKGIDKAKSLLRLLSKINLTPADMIAFGDGYNDLSMLKLAGMGVAMQNAAPEVRAEADYITLSNEEDGVAAALEHFCKKDF